MVKVLDNLLSPEEFKKLTDVILGTEFPWFFLTDKVHSGDGNFQMCHNFVLSGKPVSKFLTIINWIGLFSYILSQVRKRG